MQDKKKTNNKKLLMGRGPTTRSRANSAAMPATEDASEREDTCRSVHVLSPAPIVDLPQPDDGKGSMASFWAMRQRQKEKSEKEKVEKEKAQQEIVEKEKVAASASKKVVEENIMPDIDEGDEEGYPNIFLFILSFKNRKLVCSKKVVQNFDKNMIAILFAQCFIWKIILFFKYNILKSLPYCSSSSSKDERKNEDGQSSYEKLRPENCHRDE